VLRGSNQNKGNNWINIRHKARRHFWNKKKEYLRDKVIKPAMNSKNKNIRDPYRRNKFKGCYQPTVT
jgi:hypothetical protein